ncbi:MAG TPA: hypothetical protein VHX59_22290 [Mycobacteriales bacterium]|nr:hypothetical protein [Mycobacteriales bacterium]
MTAELARFQAAVDRARAAATADAGRLWDVDLTDARWIGAGADHWYLTEDPDQPGFSYRSPFWRGPKPAGSTHGNTAIDWAGRRWANIALPLGGDTPPPGLDRDGATRLLLHEAWHACGQETLFPDGLGGEPAVVGGDLLDRSAGRVWLRLEAAALSRAVADRSERAAGAAGCFRLRRQREATAAEWNRERTLELGEGLPEYTAWRLTGADRAAVSAHVRAIPIQNSLVRSFAYHTGPGYGFVLDDLAPGWQRDIPTVRDLPELLRRATTVPAIERAEAAAEEYGYSEILAEELARDRDRADDLAATVRRFRDGPLLRIRPDQVRIDFSPQQVRQFDFGAVYGKLAWRTEDGTMLDVDGEALVTADWNEIQVPLDRVTDDPPTAGPGWTLVLTDRWQTTRDGRGWLITPR